MNYFINRDQILSLGNRPMWEDALEILNAGILRADPGKATRDLVRVKGKEIRIAGKTYDQDSFPNIYVFGAGKATFPVAKALDDILGSWITEGIVTCKEGQEGFLATLRSGSQATPYPMKRHGRIGGILALAKKTGPGDLVLPALPGAARLSCLCRFRR